VALDRGLQVDEEGERSRTGWREDLVAAVLGSWAVVGLFLDGWAHHTRPDLESFFTPWHGVLYSGAAASAAWLGWVILRRRRQGYSWRGAVPSGYGLGLLGIVGFAATGVGDLLWHTVFGIEADIEALLSPPHLLLFISGLLMLTSPLRAAWRSPAEPRGNRLVALLPALLSLTLAVAVVAFFFHYVSPFQEHTTALTIAGEHQLASALASIFLTNLILITPLALFTRRFGAPPFGAATLLFTTVAALLNLDGAFALSEAVAGVFVGGLASDVVLGRLRPSDQRHHALWAAMSTVPALLWGAYFLSLALGDGVAWTPELWGGAIAMASLTGLGVGLLAAPPGSGQSLQVPDRVGSAPPAGGL
jgi:hypothetical protein